MCYAAHTPSSSASAYVAHYVVGNSSKVTKKKKNKKPKEFKVTVSVTAGANTAPEYKFKASSVDDADTWIMFIQDAQVYDEEVPPGALTPLA